MSGTERKENTFSGNQTLWYEKPAEVWEEGLPIGAGCLGAMIYGNADREVMQLNEDSLWYGGPMDRINPEAGKHMREVQKLILEGSHFRSGRNFEI